MVGMLADGGLLLILAGALVTGLVWVVREKPNLLAVLPYVVMAGLTSLLAAKLMSFWQPEAVRPFMELGVSAQASFIDNPGFPSDHMLLATFVSLTVYCLTPYKKTSYVLFALTLVMAAARVAALVHTPFDILGGAVAGSVGVLWYSKQKHNVLDNN